jgi:multiple sugar transport system permease protein
MADVAALDLSLSAAHRRLTMQKFVRRKSTIAFFMCLPLILVVACVVVYPAFYSISLAIMNKSIQHFVGFGNFTFLFKRNTFWMVVEQTVLFAVAAVIFKALMGFIAAHFVHNLPAKGQRKRRGMLLIPSLR